MKISLVLAMLLSSFSAFAQSGSYSRRGDQETVKWTLGDWMSQKQRFQLMDQWLAINTQQNLVEFGISGGSTNYDLKVGSTNKSHRIDRYSASLFVSIFGLEAGYENMNEDIKNSYGQFNIRVLGQSSRSTQLVLGYGIQKKESEKTGDVYEVTNQYGTANLQLYLTSFFGIDGSYRKYLKAKDDDKKYEFEGERIEYGLFLEYLVVRIYGRAFIDRTYKTLVADGTKSYETRDGADVGVRFFF